MSGFVSVNPPVCTGCRTCEVACSLFHFGECNPLRSAIRIIRREKGGLVTSLPLVCRQCRETPCIEACPTEALSRESGSAPLNIDREKCSACGECAAACPAGCLFLDNQTDLPVPCDLCGGQPQCVLLCHSHCLTLANAGSGGDPHRIKRSADLPEAEELAAIASPGKGGRP